MDRTSEFVRIVQLVSKSKNAIKLIHKPLSSYAKMGQKISDGLVEIEKLIVEFTSLVHKQSMVNDPGKEIDDIIVIVKRDIGIIKNEIQRFNQMLTTAKTQHKEHFEIVMSALNYRLSKCAKNFQNSLEKRTNVLTQQASRRSRFSHMGNSPMVQIQTPMFKRQHENGAKDANGAEKNVLETRRNPFRSPQASPTDNIEKRDGNGMQAKDALPRPGYSGGNASVHTPLMDNQPTASLRRRGGPLSTTWQGNVQTQAMQDTQNRAHVLNAQNRLHEANQVESTIAELSGMFSKMANLVAEQGDVVARIDDDMDLANMNVDAGQNELLKYFKTVSGNRSLIIKLFLVLIVFIFLFVVVF